MDIQLIIIEKIKQERDNQSKKWGKQTFHPLMWLNLLLEEIGEAAKAANDKFFNNKGDWGLYESELIQSAALIVQMLEDYYETKENLSKLVIIQTPYTTN